MHLYEEFKEYETLWDEPTKTEGINLTETLNCGGSSKIEEPELIESGSSQICCEGTSFIVKTMENFARAMVTIFWMTLTVLMGGAAGVLGWQVLPTILRVLLSAVLPIYGPVLGPLFFKLVHILCTVSISALAAMPGVRVTMNYMQSLEEDLGLAEEHENNSQLRVDLKQLARTNPKLNKQIQDFYDFARKNPRIGEAKADQILAKLEIATEKYFKKHPEILELDPKILEDNEDLIISQATKIVQKELKDFEARETKDTL